MSPPPFYDYSSPAHVENDLPSLNVEFCPLSLLEDGLLQFDSPSTFLDANLSASLQTWDVESPPAIAADGSQNLVQPNICLPESCASIESKVKNPKSQSFFAEIEKNPVQDMTGSHALCTDIQYPSTPRNTCIAVARQRQVTTCL